MKGIGRSKKTWIRLLLILLVLPQLSGCWDRLEIEERANVLAIAVDAEPLKAQKDEPEVSHLKGRFPAPTKSMVRITAQIAVPGRIPLGPGGGASGGSSEGAQKPVWVVSVVGHTLDDAMMNLQQQLADRVYLSHLRVIILSEDYARGGVENVNEYLRRNPEVRRAAWMMISKGKAAKTMNISPELERVPALYLMSTLDHAVTLGKFPNDFLGIFWSTTSSLGQQPYLPFVAIKGNNVQIAGLAYFKGTKMVDTIKPLEIGFYMAVRGLNPGGYTATVPVPGQSGSVMVQALHRKSKIKVDLQNGRPHATVKVYYESQLVEKSNPQIRINDGEILAKIEQSASDGAKKAIEQLIQETQQQGADIFGFGEYFRAKQPRYWDSQVKTKQKWSELYKDLTVDVSVTSRIRRVGMAAQ